MKRPRPISVRQDRSFPRHTEDAADAVQYAPGNDPFVISVGATDELETADTLATFSSRGVTQDGLAKPDVVAPGAHMLAPLATGSAFQALCPQCVFDGQSGGSGGRQPPGEYLKIGGTSMAAPVVAGAAALLLQARPDLNPDQVKGLLTTVTNPTAGGAAELDVARALHAPVEHGANQGTVPNPQVAAVLVEAGVDPTRASWTKASWTKASWTGGVAAAWAKATWTCDGCGIADAAAPGADPTSATWSKSSWSKSSWSSHPEW